MERMKKPREQGREQADIAAELQDRADLLQFFRRLPMALWPKHFERINNIAAEEGGDEAAHQKQIDYLTGILESRREKSEALVVGDTPLRDHLKAFESTRTLGTELESLLAAHESSLGKGQTARVKSLRIGGSQKVAVKYLLSPKPTTLPAEKEYNLLGEVETVTKIEQEEIKHDAGNRIRVPHPHFYYRNQNIQCYGMQQIEGVTLDELTNPHSLTSVRQLDLREAAWKSLAKRYEGAQEREELTAEILRFFEAVHEVCLHGDIKMGNIMVSDTGEFYLIDFGQSVSMNLASEDSRDQFENLKDLETDQFQECIRAVLNELRKRGSPELEDAA